MFERSEFNKKAEEILCFVDTYSVLRYEHLEKLFPGGEKIVGYLLKTQRLYKSADGAFVSADEGTRPDKCLTAALGVLADLLEKVQTHARATAPAQISFVTHLGDYYEIIYAGYGMEAMIAASFQTLIAAKQQTEGYEDTTKHIVIVEDKSQMERLNLPGIARFALVQPDGSLSYFKGADKNG